MEYDIMDVEIAEYLANNIATSKEIQKNCGLSARQVSTRLKNFGSDILKIPSGRSPRYALTKNAFGVGNRINIWEVDSFGKHSRIACFIPLKTGGFFVEGFIGMPNVFLGEAKNGLYDDLPYFLRDMAPQGFLGKKIAENLAQQDDNFPQHLSDWHNEHIGRYLLANNEASMGNLKFGNNVNLNIRPFFPKHHRTDYLSLADKIINDEIILSSAGGEQQKFTTYCEDIKAHVLVKFSPKGDSENARRWQDILISEHHAAQVINESGIATAAETTIIEEGGRIFLESKRFDRADKYGRHSMLSLLMIDAEFVGTGDNWVKSAKSLYAQKLLSEQDCINVENLALFAQLIYNTDTHLGNISFATHNDGFSLLPIYDMCSMGFAPKSNGEVTPFRLKEASFKTSEYINIEAITKLANTFWQRLAKDSKISKEFSLFIKDQLVR